MIKLPEPAHCCCLREPIYTKAQMLQFRRDLLEEAADTLEHGFVDDEGHHIQYAAEIRKLKDYL